MAIQLYDYQLEALNRMKNGCILCGGVGSGKSRTGLAYYYVQEGGKVGTDEYIPMKNPRDLYIITTARKRDTCEWQGDLAPFLLSPTPEANYYKNKVVIDSWNNIGKYVDVKDAFFIFDEQRVVGYGAWTKAFLKIVKSNDWILLYKDIMRTRWNPWEDRPIETAAELCMALRRVTNSDESRSVAILEIMEDHPRAIIFYSYDYELDILRSLGYPEGTEVAEWNGHKHQEIPTGKKWVYLVQYTAGCEGWNCITTDTIIFYSQQYSYKVATQAAGRIDRLNTPYRDLNYYHLKSFSGIDLAISKALSKKKNFNEGKFVGWATKPLEVNPKSHEQERRRRAA